MTTTDPKPLSAEIIGTCQGAELDKRTYLPGVVLRVKCPKCGEMRERDFARHYLSYPVVGQPEEAHAYCEPCDTTVFVNVIVRMTLEIAP